MDPPKTPLELYVWLAVQFSVLAAVIVVTRWAVRWEAQRYAELTRRNDAGHAKLVAEKDERIADRNTLIGELRGEIADLKARLSRRRKKGGGGGQKP